MAGPKDTANQVGDAKHDFGNALDDISNPQDAAHDVSKGLRDLGLGDAADALDHALGQFTGKLPDPRFALYWGKPSPLELAASTAEGLVGDLVGKTGALGDTLMHSGLVDSALHRAQTEVESRLGQGASIWLVNTYDLIEALSTPWKCTLLLHTKEVPAKIAADAGFLGGVNGMVNDFKSGNVENAIGDVAGMLGVANPDPFAGSQNKPPADDHVPQKGVALDPADYLNQQLSVSIARLAETTKGVPVVERWLTGIVTEFHDLGASFGVRFIQVTVRPALWTLSLRRDCRIWEGKNAIEIVRDVFGTASVYGAGLTQGLITAVDNLVDSVHLIPPDKVDRGSWTPKRELCVQYNETDLDFVQRLLDEEGISYYFDCEKRTERIVFIDDPFRLDKCRTVDGKDVPFVRMDEVVFQHPKGSAGRADDATVQGAQPEVLWDLTLQQRTRGNKVTLRDYNFRLAGMGVPADKVPTAGGQTPYQQEVTSSVNNGTVLVPNYQLGKSGWERSADDSVALEHYRVPVALHGPVDASSGDISTETYKPDGASAEDPAVRRADVMRSQMELGSGAGNVVELRPGKLLSVTGYLTYRNDTSAFATPLDAEWTAPTASDPNAFDTWQATQATRVAAREARDAEFKKPYLVLITKVHASAQGDAPVAFPQPPQLSSSQTRWDTTASSGAAGSGALGMLGGSGYTGAVSQTTIKTTAPGTPVLEFAPPGADGDLKAQKFFNRFEFVIVDSDAASGTAGAANTGTSLRYRPTPTVPRPRIVSLQTALVVDVDNHFADDLKQQLELDTLGYRVRLHMHWDRRGDSLLEKRRSTCWVRMATPWAGSDDARDWGTMFVPRAGMEVVVGFVDGMPERPVILGAVPNGQKQPAVVPLPQPIVKRAPPEGDPEPVIKDDPAVDPAQPVSLVSEVHRNRSVIRSQSEPITGSGTGNWIVFDDNHPNEWLQVRAQNLLMKEVLHDYKVSVGTYESPYTDTHKQVLAVGVDYNETVNGDAWLTVSDTRDITVKRAEARVNYHADHATYVIGDEKTTIERGRSATIEGFETMILGPVKVDEAETPDAPRMKLTVHGSQLLTVKNREGKDPPNGDDKLHVRKDKTDTILGKLTMEAKGGLQIGAHPAGGAAGGSAAGSDPNAPAEPAKDTQILAGVPPNPGTLELQSQDEINLSSEGIVKIRSDHNDVHLSGDKNLQLTAQGETLKLMLKDAKGADKDVLLWGKSSSGAKRIHLSIGGGGPASELIVGEEGIKLTLGGSAESSLEITPAGEIKLKGKTLKMVAKNNVNLAGQVVFKGR